MCISSDFPQMCKDIRMHMELPMDHNWIPVAAAAPVVVESSHCCINCIHHHHAHHFCCH
ncbi:hypothetical protein HYC85_000778 [Camellia sinensis]|uniref:Uncharacterized protein n=1 Tax=Camellia sinensis TaxID=4442 RepID=A0A7J7I3R8_CAMSI|nr:hypothetical protein HYC85_000778 [Camellia sinensis]